MFELRWIILWKQKKKKTLLKKLKSIDEKNKEIDFGFIGKYRCQSFTSPSWNFEGKELFEQIPCSNCEKKFTKKDLINNNYYLWTHEKFSWIDKKFNLYWDRHLINYQVIDEENKCRKFPDGKQLILKLSFIVTDITHKNCKKI